MLARPMAVTCQAQPSTISFVRIGSSAGSAGMPDSTPMTKLYCGLPLVMPFFTYMSTQRTMPVSKHSNSGLVPVLAITSR